MVNWMTTTKQTQQPQVLFCLFHCFLRQSKQPTIFFETQKHSPLSPGGQCCCSLLLHTGTSEKANSTTTKLCQSSKLKEKQCHRRPRDAVDRNWFLFNLLLLLRYEYSFKHENIARSFYHNFQIVFFFFFRLFKQWMNAQLWHTVGGLI